MRQTAWHGWRRGGDISEPPQHQLQPDRTAQPRSAPNPPPPCAGVPTAAWCIGVTHAPLQPYVPRGCGRQHSHCASHTPHLDGVTSLSEARIQHLWRRGQADGGAWREVHHIAAARDGMGVARHHAARKLGLAAALAAVALCAAMCERVSVCLEGRWWAWGVVSSKQRQTGRQAGRQSACVHGGGALRVWEGAAAPSYTARPHTRTELHASQHKAG